MNNMLKTLDEINEGQNIVEKDKLRDEAKKWIKDMKAEQPYESATKKVILWAKIFFNIDEK